MEATKQRRQALIEDLRLLFAQAKLPTSPALAVRIIELANDPRSAPADFAEAIRTDPALAARLLARANSVQFAQRVPVSTIERAVTVLGLRRLRTTALAFQLVRHLDRLGKARYDLKTFWQHSLLRACLGRSIARSCVDERAEEAYLIGLLLDCGIPVLVQLLGDRYARTVRSRKLSPAALLSIERSSFQYTHVDAIAALAAEWNLPEIIARPLEHHHDQPDIAPNAADTERLCAVAFFTGGLCFSSKVRTARSEQNLQQFREAVLGIDDDQWERIQKLALTEYAEDSEFYRNLVGDGVDIADLLSQANQHLAAAAEEADRSTLETESKRHTIFRKHVLVSSALRDYRERAANDPLTNLANRGALVEITRRAIARNLANSESLGVLFVDLDNFKHLNDTFGHAAGDEVLKVVARVLHEQVGSSGHVGRFGGEEFVAIVEGLTAQEFRELAERVLAQVRTAARDESRWGMVTCSAGGLWAQEAPVRSAEDLFSLADDLMYEAKQAGKDRCCLRLLGTATDPDSEGEGLTLHGPTGVAADAPTLADLLATARRLKSAGAQPALSNARKERRRRSIQPCQLRFFGPGARNAQTFDAATCDISAGGVCVLVALPVPRGELVEVVFDPGETPKYAAGLVASCRHVVGSIHEIGIQVIQRGDEPVIVGEPAEAMRRLRRRLQQQPADSN